MSSDPLVETTWRDAYRQERTVAPEVRAAVLGSMGLDDDTGVPDRDAVAIVRRGSRLPAAGTVRLEDGSDLGRVDVLPADAPFGYHELARDDGARQVLITGPGRCHLPADLRAWGLAVQLATLRSRRSWGIGDVGDMRELGGWAVSRGAGFLAVSPLGAPNPGPVPEPSPYYPSTRRFGNPLLLRIDEVEGWTGDEELVRSARALNDERPIDRARVWALKRRALEAIWDAGIPDRSAFDTWRRAQGETLERWSAFCVLTEQHGAGWQSWPADCRDPDGSGRRAAVREAPDRVAFHSWIQWCLDRQLATASAAVRRIADLPIGADPGGFDAWDWQDTLALGASIGAPPDRFTAAGQDWGLPPFIPHRLRDAAYRPFVQTIRAQLRHAGGLRMDHVLGLFRLWWIPAGSTPDAGAYVRSATDELLEIVAIESHRAGAIVIGEDLGTVSAGVRAELRRRRLLSTRLVIFERVPPSRYPRQSFAAITTHDLPTVAGILSGSDLADQAAAGIAPDADALELLRSRLVRAAGTGPGADPAEVVTAVTGRLAASASALIAGSLEDALGVPERHNLPGTVAEQRPNWSQPLPIPLEEIVTDPRVERMADSLGRTRSA